MENKPQLSKLPDNASKFRIFIFKMIDSKVFGAAILCVILVNTVILIIQTDEEISVRGGWYFSVIDNVFLAIYIVELILKLYALRWSYFKTGWNVMDFSIVVFTTSDFLLPLIVQNVGSFDVAAIFRLLRMFRAIRALRALRVLRTIRFLKNLQVIMTTILKSFRALSTIVMLQSLFLCMFAVIGRGLFYKVAPSRFGSILRAIYTLFQLITLDDWYYMYTDVVNANSDYTFIIIYLIIYIVLENFIFLNLFVAVLVDNFQRTLTAAEARKKEKNKHRTLFVAEENADDDGSVSIFSNQNEETSDSTPEYWIHLPVIEDFYSVDEISCKRDRELLSDYFKFLSTMEYNMHQTQIQQRLLDELVDITVNIPDVPEELI
ncbi:cation channel sperm-associated protein 1-like isoform X1 [Hydractinia symbiolongicarpus]|uniref:cation channel sperm-associated protein 1-like isoform X1 n=1 Tax=Hydractinia symbiolongicarpus TaxID=13093 RepID=UPI002550EF1B|nr:cation channel sperm-associated protein 1-like isoform X1 [Hydractinia symbiolongicarpus]XP_057316450.1 cation channel sperm-associated protein 1-like isoform X1 [Hydractinia symbiolongicarpus]